MNIKIQNLVRVNGIFTFCRLIVLLLECKVLHKETGVAAKEPLFSRLTPMVRKLVFGSLRGLKRIIQKTNKRYNVVYLMMDLHYYY